MNQFTEVYRRKARSRSGHSRQHEREVARALTSKDRQRIRRIAGQLLLAAIAVSAIGYFLAAASLALIVAAVGVLLVLFGLLVAWGFYVLDNVR